MNWLQGPLSPNGVIRATMRDGKRSARESGARPSCLLSPPPLESRRMSAPAMSRSIAAFPSSELEIEDDGTLAAVVGPKIERLLLVDLFVSERGNEPRRRSPGGSILMTSAPSPASNKPQYSAVSSAYSMTVRPESMPGASDGASPSAAVWRSVVRADSSVMMMLRCGPGRVRGLDSEGFEGVIKCIICDHSP